MFRLNSDSQSDEFVTSQRGDDRFQTVVTASRSAFTNPNATYWQSEIIGNHNHILLRLIHIVLRKQTRNGLTTQVHECLRLHQFHGDLVNNTTSNQRIALTSRDGDSCLSR